MRVLLPVVACLLLAGCFGGGPGGLPSGCGEAPTIKHPDSTLVANAGFALEAAPNDPVFLDGSESHSTKGASFTYHWRQTSGPCATLDLTNPAQPVLRVPSEAQVGEVLTFVLVLQAGGSRSAPDTTELHVVAPS